MQEDTSVGGALNVSIFLKFKAHFQLKFVIISRLKSHVICYKLSNRAVGSTKIQVGEKEFPAEIGLIDL